MNIFQMIPRCFYGDLDPYLGDFILAREWSKTNRDGIRMRRLRRNQPFKCVGVFVDWKMRKRAARALKHSPPKAFHKISEVDSAFMKHVRPAIQPRLPLSPTP